MWRCLPCEGVYYEVCYVEVCAMWRCVLCGDVHVCYVDSTHIKGQAPII